MAELKTVFVGTISKANSLLHTVLRGRRPEIIYELNSWIFDYCFARHLTILQLPPLDDWNHSHEDVNYWSYHIPELNWTCAIRSEVVSL